MRPCGSVWQRRGDSYRETLTHLSAVLDEHGAARPLVLVRLERGDPAHHVDPGDATQSVALWEPRLATASVCLDVTGAPTS